jgi:magnesium chelatase subunit I
VSEARGVQGLIALAHRAGIAPDAPDGVVASAIDFVLEGLYSQKKIGRSDERGYHGTEPVRRPTPAQRTPLMAPDEDDEQPRKKKRYYN